MSSIFTKIQSYSDQVSIRYAVPYSSSAFISFAAPKRGSIVDSYRSVDCKCSKCRSLLFKYKKKNGTKSNLVKMYIERIYEDYYNILDNENVPLTSELCVCPRCNNNFGRPATIKGRPAIKIIGNRLRMT